jgi:hypothetical protein
MPDLPQNALASLAASGAPDRQIVAALGRKMTGEEKAIVDKARLVLRLKKSQAAQSPGRLSAAEKMRKARNRDRLKPYRTPDAKALKLRARLEKHPDKWLSYYLPDRFPLPFGDVHRQIITSCVRAMTQGTSITVAAPRGFGKTAVLWGMALYGVMTGLCRFPVVIGWKASAGAELLDQWLSALSENERLREAYPCQCDIFAESVQSTRVKGMLRSLDPEQLAGSDVRKGRGCVILPDVQETGGRMMKHCALAGASMNGSIKGLNIGMITGESLRPDIVLMDDPQDEETADSEKLVKKVVKKIDYGIRSLSGPRRRLTVMAEVTCVSLGDVSENLLTRPGTEAIKTGQITAWPAGWDADDSPSRAAWDEWNRVRLDGLGNLDGGRAARAYYREHKTTLAAGMAVSWIHRFHASDGLRVGDPDAIYAAMWDFYDLGEFAFMAERQNMPLKEGVTVYSLQPGHITARADNDRPAGIVPEWCRIVIAASDINPSYGLSTVIAGFGSDQRAAVLWYGVHRTDIGGDMTEAQKKGAIMAALEAHGRELAVLSCRPARWIIDGGGSPLDTVITFAATSVRTCGLESLCAFGRAWRQVRPKAEDRRYEHAFIRAESRARMWAIWNADYWKELAQRAWIGAVGAPGTCDLPKGNHRDFAEQICREPLAGKTEMAGTWVYLWHHLPGPHDYGDCMAMLFAMAAMAGIGTGGGSGEQKQKKKCCVVINGKRIGG